MIFSGTHGHETFDRPPATYKISLFYRRRSDGEDLPLFMAHKDAKSEVRILSQNNLLASLFNRNSGTWCDKKWDLPEGSYVKLKIEKRDAGSYLYDTAVAILRIRQDAALRIISIPLSGNPQGTRLIAYQEGRFDIVNQSELDDCRYFCGSQDRMLLDKNRFPALAKVKVVETERTPYKAPVLQTIATVSGKEVTIQAPSKKRVIRMRKL